MMEHGESGEGFSILDGVASVMGAAVASVHIRGLIRQGLSGFGWLLLWGTFIWVALTATGPFLFLVRRFARRLPRYPRVGDLLWALLGIPWIMTAILRSIAPGLATGRNDLFTAVLGIGLVSACLIALAVVWSTWVMVPPQQAAGMASTPWTNRLGLVLSIAWPVQCGIGLVFLS